MNLKVTVYQGCHGKMQLTSRALLWCLHCEKGKKTFFDKSVLGYRTSSRMSDSHYNFLQDCSRHIQGFNSQSLEVPEDLELTDIHKNQLHQQFGKEI